MNYRRSEEIMKLYKFVTLSFICGGLFCSDLMAANISIDDLLPPAQAETEEQREQLLNIKQVGQVVVSKDQGIDGKSVVEAASCSDAVNYALKNMSELDDGVMQVKFPSGLGWISRGTSDYAVYENPTATYIAQRKAYVVAYINAKTSLAKALNSFSNVEKETLKEQIKSYSDEEKDLNQVKSSLVETSDERINALIRGYVVYDVNDSKIDDTNRTVAVAIVTTNKTLNGLRRLSENAISANSVQDGLKQILAELNNKIIPPIGGTSIFVPQTGEMAFVGYGSSVVRSGKNVSVQRKLLKSSSKIAQMRARSALVGILKGDNIESITKSMEDTTTDDKEFVELTKNDPLNKNNENEIVELEKAQNKFRSMQTYNDTMSSFRNGIVPPGVIVKTFEDDKKPVVTAIAIYMPSMTDAAKQMGKAMQEAGNQDFAPERTAELNRKNTTSTRHSDEVVPGVTGKVTNDQDL